VVVLFSEVLSDVVHVVQLAHFEDVAAVADCHYDDDCRCYDGAHDSRD